MTSAKIEQDEKRQDNVRRQQPDQAIWHFQQAQKTLTPSNAISNLAAYDIAIALFQQGA